MHIFILKLSITASLYGSRVYSGVYIYDCSHNIPIAIYIITRQNVVFHVSNYILEMQVQLR